MGDIVIYGICQQFIYIIICQIVIYLDDMLIRFAGLVVELFQKLCLSISLELFSPFLIILLL